MRPWWVVVLAGCSFEKSLIAADAPSMFDDAGREIRAWKLDTAADFGATGAQTIDMTVDPLGALTPEGYVYGVLVARGVQGTKLWTNADADWAKTAMVSPVGYGLWAGNDLTVSARELAFVNITNPAMISVWFEGEMWINPNESFSIAGNDTAFVYAALDGNTFTKYLHDSAGAIAVPAAGWYPVRIGWADGDASGGLAFQVSSGGGFVAIDHTRFRATTSQLRGMYRSVFYREIHGGGIGGAPPVTTIQGTPIHAVTTFSPPLPGSVTTAVVPFDWSARWSGQFYAAAAGAYTFRIDSNDGSRIQLGTQVASMGFARNAKGAVATVVTADLVAGWNDLVIDYNHVDGPPTFAVAIMAAPPADAALVEAPIPADRLRPIEPRADRLITRSTIPSTPATIQKGQPLNFSELTARIDAHPGELVSSVEITARVTSPTPNPNQLLFRLVAPNNQQQARAMTIVSDGNGGGSRIAQGVFDVAAGTPANGTWRFGISDNSPPGGGGNSSYHELHVTVHTTGGREQIARTATWRSAIVENATDVVQIDHVTWSQRAPAGSSITMRMRTCAMADCSDGVWSEPLTSGAAPTLTPHRFLQLQLEMTSNGTSEPEVDQIDVQYRTAPKP